MRGQWRGKECVQTVSDGEMSEERENLLSQEEFGFTLIPPEKESEF
jgi:hypothetical protein